MIRKIVNINQEKCTGCGLCASACHENAIVMENGKAHLLKDDFCDGFGDCLPSCPAGAITIEERESSPYDEKAVAMRKEVLKMQNSTFEPAEHKGHGCPGSQMHTFTRNNESQDNVQKKAVQNDYQSELLQWPVQIKLLPAQAPFFNNAHLLIAADCTAYAYAAFHRDFIHNHITLIGCPKLDDIDYTEKLTQIIQNNSIKSVTIVRMEVPCCSGLQIAAENALRNSGKFIPWSVKIVSRDGRLIEEDL